MGLRHLLLALGLLLAGPAWAAISLLDDRGRVVELPGPAIRVVTLSPSLTETVCSLGACERLVGVDRYSNWPESIKNLPRLGGLEDTQIERIVALKPDVVLAASSIRAIERLESLGIRVVALEAKSLPDTQRVIQQVALALGEAPAGAALWQRMRERMQGAAARVPPALRGRKVYFEAASPGYGASESSFIGDILAQLGMGNVVPASLGPFPKLNPEYVVRAQPQLVMASARGLADMPSRPGWAALVALQDKQTCGFAAAAWDTLVRAGPRLADGAEALADCLAGLVPVAR
jgi:iron complex transport system substrate-binding protein